MTQPLPLKKTCSRCGIEKPLSAFGGGFMSTGSGSLCSSCRTAMANNPHEGTSSQGHGQGTNPKTSREQNLIVQNINEAVDKKIADKKSTHEKIERAAEHKEAEKSVEKNKENEPSKKEIAPVATEKKTATQGRAVSSSLFTGMNVAQENVKKQQALSQENVKKSTSLSSIFSNKQETITPETPKETKTLSR